MYLLMLSLNDIMKKSANCDFFFLERRGHESVLAVMDTRNPQDAKISFVGLSVLVHNIL